MTEFTTVTHVAAGEGETINVMGELSRIALPAGSGTPSLSIIEITTQPGGGPPALHTHPPMEAFYVLEGEYEFATAGTPIRARAGSVVYVPSNVPHNYKNVGTAPGRILAIFTQPAAEHFLREMAAASSIPPDMGRLGAVMQKYEVAFVGPPPGAPAS